MVRRAASEFVTFVNEYNRKYTDLCEKLQLSDVHEAARLLPNKKMLSFKISIDEDGQLPDLSERVRLTSAVLQIKVSTIPGAGIFEFSAIYDMSRDKLIFQVGT